MKTAHSDGSNDKAQKEKWEEEEVNEERMNDTRSLHREHFQLATRSYVD